jgi:sugar phosphate isomerase/epimerase
MKILMLSNPYDNIFNQINLVRKIGFDGIEIVLELETKKLFLKNRKKLIKEVKDFFHIFHLDNSYNIFERNDLREIRKILNKLDSFAVLHLNCNREKFESFIEKVESLKINNILIENLDHSIEDLEYFLEISNLNLAFDLSHAFSFNNKEKIINFLNEYEKRIKHFHLSDCVYFQHSHLPLGNGILPIKEVINFLKNKTVTLEIIETEIPEIDYSISLNILKSL